MTRLKRSFMPRRTLLRGALGGVAVSLALPTLDIMLDGHGTAYANGLPLPKRFGIFFWGNGVRLSTWVPSATGANWALSDAMSPLAENKDYISAVSGCSVKPPGRGHHSGTVGMLAAAPLLEREPEGGAPYASTFSAPSMDQVVADVIGKDSTIRSLEIGIAPSVKTDAGTTKRYLSHNGPDNPNPAEYKPRALFDRLFGDGLEPADNTRLRLRRSFLDAVLADANELKPRLGATDKVRIDQHLDSIRALEHQLEQLEQSDGYPPECELPATPPQIDAKDYETLTKVMSELLTMALVCDMTRVFSIQFSGPNSTDKYLDIPTQFHGLTHNEAGDQPGVQRIVKFTMAQLNTVLTTMRTTVEGAGNVLDSVAMLSTTDVDEGKTHNRNDQPILVAGKCHGALVHPGIHYRSTTSENTSNVHFSLAKALELGVSSYGTGLAESNQVVPGLLV